MTLKLVIVGGVAGGASAAARARRLSESAEIILVERGPYVSFANCGLPYHIGGEIGQRDKLLVQTVDGLRQRFRLDVRTRCEVTAIDAANRTVRIRNLETGEEQTEAYDKLVLSPGAAPLRPPIPGIDHARIHTLRNMQDMDRIKAAVDEGAKSALVVGGGFIGLEMAENLHRRGLHVTLVELLPQVMPPLDPEIAGGLHAELSRHDVKLHLADGVVSFEDASGAVRATLKSGAAVTCDLVILSVGVKPDTALAEQAGVRLGARGAIEVDQHMRTSDPNIYAIGDAVLVEDFVLGGPTLVPLAGPANRQARIAVDHIFGRGARFRGVQGTSVVRVFDKTVAMTGASEKTLRQRAVRYEKVYIHPMQHAGYFPGAQQMMLKLLFDPESGRVLGAQAIGGDGVDKRIDVLATAIQAGLTVFDLEEVELAYAPQYGSAKDPINMAGFVASNVVRGDDHVVHVADLDELDPESVTIVDVRQPAEFERGAVPNARLHPLPNLRDQLDQIPTDKPVIVYCQAGQRGYFASRILQQHGYDVRNLSGGYLTFAAVQGARQSAEKK